MSTGHQRTISDRVICVAFQRGVPAPQLARSTGISLQRVHQILKAQGITVGRHKRSRRAGHVARPCQFCGQIEWVVPSELVARKYCSSQCRNETLRQHYRRIPERDVLRAIELRKAGYTWQQIQRELGWTHQTLKRWIWRLLAERGELTEAKAVELLQDTRGRLKVSWKWLEKTTGLKPQMGSAGGLPAPAISINLDESGAAVLAQ